MRVIELQNDWSIDNLALAERADPEPGAGQVLLKMKAASINYRDAVVMQQGYGSLSGTLPLIPLSDGVGEVVAVGAEVNRVAVGDRVCPTFFQGWISGEPSEAKFATSLGGPRDGVMAELMVVSEESVVKAPAHLSDEAAATLPCAALTAWSALVTYGRVRPGDRVLIQGTGGVSLFGLQIAKLMGAEAIVTSSSDEKLQRASALGADRVINYKSTPEWGKAVRALLDGEGVDHIIEVGGAGTLSQSLRAVRVGGRISMIGVLSGHTADLRLGPVVTRQVAIQGITVGHREGFEAMNRAIAQHRLEPVLDRVFGFEELRAALDHLSSGAHFGKVCLVF